MASCCFGDKLVLSSIRVVVGGQHILLEFTLLLSILEILISQDETNNILEKKEPLLLHKNR